MYFFTTNEKYNELIKEGIEICNKLSIPISDSVIFKLSTGRTHFGYCILDKEYKYKIFINKNIVSNEKIINTVIHELLHTIPNEGFKPHKGNWEKYAKIVSDNTKYKITVSDKAELINYSAGKPKPVKRCFCPICGEIFESPINKIYLGRSYYYCKYHLKYYYEEYPNSPLKDMKDFEREEFVEKAFNEEYQIEEYVGFLPYTSILLTRKIIKFILNKFEFSYWNIHMIAPYIRIDKTLLEELAKEWCQGVYVNKIKSDKERISFEGIFSLTKWWIEVTEYSNKRFGTLGSTNY